MPLTPNLHDREQGKFVESPTRPNGTAVEVYLVNPEDIAGGGGTSSEVKITDGTDDVSITDVAGKKALDVFPSNTSGTPLNVITSNSSSSVIIANNENTIRDSNRLQVTNLDSYQVQDYDESDLEWLYVGLSKLNGEYLIKQIRLASGAVRYANGGTTSESSYDVAWDDRLTHAYRYLYEIGA